MKESFPCGPVLCWLVHFSWSIKHYQVYQTQVFTKFQSRCQIIQGKLQLDYTWQRQRRCREWRYILYFQGSKNWQLFTAANQLTVNKKEDKTRAKNKNRMNNKITTFCIFLHTYLHLVWFLLGFHVLCFQLQFTLSSLNSQSCWDWEISWKWSLNFKKFFGSHI